MSTNNFASAIDYAVQNEDQTKEQQGGGKLIPAGVTIGRFIGYIELGPQHQPPYKGKPKPDCEMVRLVFELLHPQKNINEGQNGTYTDVISCTVPKKFSGKAKFFKIMKQMKYGRDVTHMAQMLGDAFKITIFHVEGDNNTYASLFDTEFNSKIEAPFVERQDDLGNVIETKLIPVPAATRDLMCFIWANPTMECWSSIYIDGTYTETVNGKEIEKSKNKWQNMLMESPGFPGSALEAMLSGAGQLPGQDELAAAGLGAAPKRDAKKPADDLADIASQVAANASQAAPAQNADPTPAQPQKTSPAPSQAQAAGAAPASAASASTEARSGDDALAALGL